jgi:Uncharacterized conserved protein (DUF2358)
MYIFHILFISYAFVQWNVYSYPIHIPNSSSRYISFTTKHSTRRCFHTIVTASNKKEDETVPDMITKGAWYAVEAFGNIFRGSDKEFTKSIIAYDQPPNSIQETQERIRMDNERLYFLSGRMDELIYSEDCTFADPFVSFNGRKRFISNLSNLGSFIVNYNARPLDYTVTDNTVNTKFMVKLQLNLPWKPILAWPWGVRCTIDSETNLIVLHEESVRICTKITSDSLYI